MSARTSRLSVVFCFALLFLLLFFIPFPTLVEPVRAIEPCVPVSFGNPPTSGSVAAAGEVDCYTFDGSPGNRIRVDAEATSGALDPYWQVLGPGDAVLCDWEIIGPSDCLLNANGTHKIYVKDFGDSDTGVYRLFVQRLDTPAGCTGVSFGAPPLAGSTSSAAQENCYTFNGFAGERIRLDVEATSGALSPYWQVLQPNGVVACDWEIIPPTDCELLSSGTHTVLVKDFAGTDTGSYKFFIQNLNSPTGCTAITYGGSAKERAIGSAAQENCFRFNGLAGDKVKVYTFKTSGALTPYWQVVQPDGTVMCDWEIISPSNCNLSMDGMHTLLVRDFAGTRAGKYYASICTNKTHCRLVMVPPPVSIAGHDGWILETSETSNRGGAKNSTATTLRLGDDAARKQYRSLLSFATGGLPDNAVVTKVLLKVKKQGILGGGDPVAAFQGLLIDVKKGYFGSSLALEAADFQASASKSCGPFKPVAKNNWYTLNLGCARAYVNKLTNMNSLTQVRLRFKLDDNNNATANFLSLYSGNAATASRPQLIIEYYIP